MNHGVLLLYALFFDKIHSNFIELYHKCAFLSIEFAVFYKYFKNVKNLIITIAKSEKMYYNNMEWENIHKQIIFLGGHKNVS